MRINFLSGFRRIGWVVVCLCLPVVVFVTYQESQVFGGFSEERIAQRYPRLSRNLKLVDESGKPREVKIGDRLSQDELINLSLLELIGDSGNPPFKGAVAVLLAEIIGSLERRKQDVLADMRSRSEFPYGWEVETKELNTLKFGVSILLAEAVIIAVVQGGIAVLAWIVRGFTRET